MVVWTASLITIELKQWLYTLIMIIIYADLEKIILLCQFNAGETQIMLWLKVGLQILPITLWYYVLNIFNCILLDCYMG